MPEPREPSPSGFDPLEDLGPPTGGADRFWQGFGRAGSEGRRRRGEPGNGHAPGSEPHGHPHQADHGCVDWCPICRSADVVRAGAPPELRGQWQALQRDALLAVRAVIDAYLERMPERRPPRERGGGVEDIPID